ncbi:TPA: polysaccharide pyruvyl transferase family protein, partial [Escherichia coli]|nr:polysaccharide pyruvyl transferase family protein [Escherichia coli]EFI2168234.1 polysaccharide pyruvyl transferase family protein [Escherichia coli]EGT1766597.1 polysaccharide pyruvyl transferase family protein [Escherichia coli]
LKRKYKRFKAFSDFINKYIACTPLNKDTKCFDIIFLGSDQIWNANYTNGVDPNYYGQGPYCKAHKLVSYAASMGKLCLGKYEEQAFLSLINNIQQIGVRENYLKTYIEEKTDLKCDVNLDPTLLLTKSDWDKLAAPNDTQERYLLIYEMHTHRSTNIIANKIAKILNLKIKKLACRTNYKIEKDVITNAGPQNFLTLFKNAAFVVTTSFHGTVFSIINQVPFFTLEFGNEIDLRSRSLLEMLNLNERMISDDANLNYEKLFLEFDEAHSILESKRQDSLSFIERALS